MALAVLWCGCEVAPSPPRPSAPVAAVEQALCPTFTPPWWDSAWLGRRQLTVNAAGVPSLPAGYSVGLRWDSRPDVSSGAMLASGDDVRVVYFNGTSFQELHRHLRGMNTAATEVWFKTQATITGSSGAYWLYFKRPAPPPPLANWSDGMAGTSPVYLAADSFESYPTDAGLAASSSWQGSSQYTVQLDPQNPANKVARVVGTGGSAGYLFNGSFGWTDVALQVRYRLQSTSARFMGFFVRANNASPMQMLFSGFASPATNLQLWSCDIASPTSTALSAGTAYGGASWATTANDGAWHEHLVAVRGTRVRHAVDSSTWFPAAAPTAGYNANPLPAAGRVGLCSGYDNGTAWADDVIVRMYLEPEPTVTAAATQAGCDPCATVTCVAMDGCHLAGTCNPSTGACSNPSKPDGASCDDGDACTRSDACLAGACTGASPVVCAAADACHLAGSCNPLTGACSDPPKPDGSACDDGNACTQVDTCAAGACTGASPVSCTAADACHLAGTCDPQTGTCSSPARPDGSACDDGNACTQVDTCAAGTCTGASPVVCAAADACHLAGTCDPQTGTCGSPASPDGTACDDGEVCTQGDSCQAGQCVAGAASCAEPTCAQSAACQAPPPTCSSPAKNDPPGCAPVVCAGVTCEAPGECQEARCDAAGDCVAMPLPEGTECAAGKGRCAGGACALVGPRTLRVGFGCAAGGELQLPGLLLLLLALARARR